MEELIMPRTKPKSKPNQPPEMPAPLTNGPVGEVLTLAETAAYLRLPEKDVIAAVSSQGLPGRMVGGRNGCERRHPSSDTGSLSEATLHGDLRSGRERAIALGGPFRRTEAAAC